MVAATLSSGVPVFGVLLAAMIGTLTGNGVSAFLNFVFLNLYLYNFQGNNLNLSTFAWLSLIILGFHLKSYQSYASFALALTFIALSYDANHLFLSISSISLSALLILLGAINLYFKHYFLSILTISLLLIGNYSNLYPTNAIILKGFYSFFTFLLGIHFIKENNITSEKVLFLR